MINMISSVRDLSSFDLSVVAGGASCQYGTKRGTGDNLSGSTGGYSGSCTVTRTACQTCVCEQGGYAWVKYGTSIYSCGADNG